jgi:hypothetical protein
MGQTEKSRRAAREVGLKTALPVPKPDFRSSPQQRTSLDRAGSSVSCHNRTFAVHSITSSALATIAGGTEIPNRFAALRLIDNSNFVAW